MHFPKSLADEQDRVLARALPSQISVEMFSTMKSIWQNLQRYFMHPEIAIGEQNVFAPHKNQAT